MAKELGFFYPSVYRHDDTNLCELYYDMASDQEFVDYFTLPHRAYLKKYSPDTYKKIKDTSQPGTVFDFRPYEVLFYNEKESSLGPVGWYWLNFSHMNVVETETAQGPFDTAEEAQEQGKLHRYV